MTFPKPVDRLQSNSHAFENTPLLAATGFREYDARWWFGHRSSSLDPTLNLMGVQALGMGLGTLIQELGAGRDIVTGHDFRSYSLSIKQALITGLMAAGANVKDIGLALSPMAYFAQFALDVPSVAMVTASHNDNGWTGVKMGARRPMTFGPDEMSQLKDIVLNGRWNLKAGGSYKFIGNFEEQYIADLTNRKKFERKIKAVIACGNGTAGAFAPKILAKLGIEVVPMDTELDHSFPNYNPDPENLNMLHAMAKRVRGSGADLALGFDGDGDRCGVVDNEGQEIFADKIGLLLARELSSIYDNRQFVVDMKSTELFSTDPVLGQRGVKTDYYKSGHSYIKRRMNELNALAGFEKSGHFFFNPPIGRGYDDGILAAIAICDLLENNRDSSMADLRRSLPVTYDAPPIGFYCPDTIKYQVEQKIVSQIQDLHASGRSFSGAAIKSVNIINGVRVTCSDGTWGLIRASSNEPKLVVVVESPVSETRKIEMQNAIERLLNGYADIGPAKQKS
jgi:phosphomannomutase/phosphoglucomutase